MMIDQQLARLAGDIDQGGTEQGSKADAMHLPSRVADVERWVQPTAWQVARALGRSWASPGGPARSGRQQEDAIVLALEAVLERLLERRASAA